MPALLSSTLFARLSGLGRGRAFLIRPLLVLTVLIAGLAITPVGSADATTTLGYRATTTAASLKGHPYRYGSEGPYYFDCSGYTRYVFRKVGKYLPRTSSAQSAYVKHVNKVYKRPGDLIFFYSSSGHVFHVGIYAGNGYIWHAPHTGAVVRKERIWTSRYMVGRVG
ncbi:MAG: C40 family peptidase [Actinomycetes bacterium]